MARYLPTARIIDNNGKPIVGAKTYFYETGTTTLKTIYSDSGLTVTQANPVLSLAGGVLPEIFISSIYKVIQKDENDVQIGVTRDPSGNVNAGQFDPWLSTKSYSFNDIVKGSDLAHYKSLVAGIETNQGNDPISSPTKWGDATFATIDGTETLTNKTMTDPVITASAGNITVGTRDVAGMVILDVPVQILNNVSSLTTSWATLNVSQLNGTGARFAIIRIFNSGTATNGTGAQQSYSIVKLAKSGKSGVTNNAVLDRASSASANKGVTTNAWQQFLEDSSEVIVPLDSNQDFQWGVYRFGLQSGGAELNLVGYFT